MVRVLKSNQESTDIVDGFTNVMTTSNNRAILVGSEEWHVRVDVTLNPSRFAYHFNDMVFTAHVEKRRNDLYWFAFRQLNGKRVSFYLGASTQLTAEKLRLAASTLHQKLVEIGALSSEVIPSKPAFGKVPRDDYKKYIG